MRPISFITDLIWRFFSEASDEEEKRINNFQPQTIRERTQTGNVREMDLHEFLTWGKETHELFIPVTESSFEPLDPKSHIEASSIRASMQDSDDRSAYLVEIPKYIRKGVVRVFAQAIDYGLIEISKVIQEGDRGDSDGYGMEPDTWIVAYLNHKGEFVSPFSLTNSKSNWNIRNFFIAGLNPFDEKGKVRICPFDRVEKELYISGYFRVNRGEYWGLADKNLQLVIPLEYKMLHACKNETIWARLPNDLCGILNLKNQFIIPPEYEYLSYIEDGYLKGYYKAEKDEMSGVIDLENRIIFEFTSDI